MRHPSSGGVTLPAPGPLAPFIAEPAIVLPLRSKAHAAIRGPARPTSERGSTPCRFPQRPSCQRHLIRERIDGSIAPAMEPAAESCCQHGIANYASLLLFPLHFAN